MTPVMYVDPSGESFIAALLVGALIGGFANLFGQAISDVVTSVIIGEVYISSWETYLGAFVGGAVGDALFAFGVGGLMSGFVSGFATGSITTGVGYGLEMINGKRDGTMGSLFAHMLLDGSIGGFTGQLIYVNNVNVGSNSFQQVFKSGITKISRYGFKMSSRVIAKGFATNLICGSGLDIYYGIKQAVQNSNSISYDVYPFRFA
jgi:hypothetical protein